MATDAPVGLLTVAALEAKLQALLERAREIKGVCSIEPPVPTSDVLQDIAALGNDVYDAQPKTQRHVVLESAARNIFNRTLHETSIAEAEFVRVWDLLDVLILCGDLDQCEPILPFYLIEELLESQTTDQCRLVFDYLESRRERLMQKEFYKTHLVVLRACNELLRRLSRAEDAVFCGRVFFFLFQSFPLGDKSSVNLRGEFHVDNVTTFEKDLEPLPIHQSSETMDIDTKPLFPAEQTDAPETLSEREVSIGSTPIVRQIPQPPVHSTRDEYSRLYPVFWKLQQDFSVPTRLFEEQHFKDFKQGLASTMGQFKKNPGPIQTRAIGDDTRGIKRKYGQDGSQEYNSNYNPKYLTSRDLFELELSDLAFQRHISVQALILVDFLLSLTEKARSKTTDANIAKLNSSLVYQYTLSDEDRQWAKKTREDIADYLKAGPDGSFYYRMVNTVLSRDKNWVRWKLESCPSIVSDAVPLEQSLEAKATARQATANRRMRVKPMGAIDLTFLSDVDNVKGLDSLKDPSRFVAPSIDQLTKGILNDELDLDMAMTDGEKRSLEAAKESKSWRALRTASRQCFAKLDRIEAGKSLQDVLATGEGVQDLVDDKDDVAPVAGEGQTPEVQAVT